MLLIEVLKSPVPWKVREHRPDYFDATFIINNIKYITRMSAFLDAGPQEWDIEFYPDLDRPTRERYNILNLGNELQVFSTVLDIIQKFIKEYHPPIVSFSAHQPSRMKLYNRLIKTLFPTWKKSVYMDHITLYRPSLKK